MNRREVLFSIGGGVAASMLRAPAWATGSALPRKTRLGIDDFSYNIRSRAEQAGYTPNVTQDPLTFLKYCHSIGAGGLQCVIGKRDEAYVKELRACVEDNDLFIEDSVWLGGNVERLRQQVIACDRLPDLLDGLAGGLDHLTAFANVVRSRLLDVHVLAPTPWQSPAG